MGTRNITTGAEVWRYNGTTWAQINIDGFGDSNTVRSTSMTVLGGGLYVGAGNLTTGTEIWRTSLPIQIPLTSQPIDTNKPMRSLAAHRISQVQRLFEEIQRTCDKLKDEDDPLYNGCCANRLDEVQEFLEMVEKFYMGGNYIAANYWALKALNLLQEIEECYYT